MGQGVAGAVARQEARPPNFFTPSLPWRGIIFIVRGDPKDHEKLLCESDLGTGKALVACPVGEKKK
jgi:hypothetical protein